MTHHPRQLTSQPTGQRRSATTTGNQNSEDQRQRRAAETECSHSKCDRKADRCSGEDQSRRARSIGDQPDARSGHNLRNQQRGDQRATDACTVDPVEGQQDQS